MGKRIKKPKSITQKPFTPKSLKPQHTRKLIRRFHVLLKVKKTILEKLLVQDENWLTSTDKAQYESGKNDFELGKNHVEIFKLDGKSQGQLAYTLGQIDGEIAKNGGLEVYQTASQQGQSTSRGSDSSKKLVSWLETYKGLEKLSALEIGCLSPNNLISKSKLFDKITRIDLNSQHHLILQQDFMARPLPASDDEKFNVISCLLVLNFVPTPVGRGQMLRRITEFLVNPKEGVSILFLVLPLPCITNSRYLTDGKILELMQFLGFKMKYVHKSNKLVYYLFEWNGRVSNEPFKKQEINPGKQRNNFSIVL